MDLRPSPSAEGPSAQLFERRRSPRQAVGGEVILRSSEPDILEVHAELLDVSASGFRAAHDCLALISGKLVQFSHARGCGMARVVWNRVADGRIEAGFVIISHGV